MDKLESLAWLLALPAAAECVASVWIPEMSLLGADVKLVFLNATGALLEGVFSAWEGGRAPAPPGAVGPTGASSVISRASEWAAPPLVADE